MQRLVASGGRRAAQDHFHQPEERIVFGEDQIQRALFHVVS
jgi:hypothetical protein